MAAGLLAVAAAVVLPLVFAPPVSPVARAVTVAVAVAAVAAVSRLPRSWAAGAGTLLVAGASWSLTQARDGILVPVLGGVLGIGVGLAVLGRQPKQPGRLPAVVSALALVALVAVTAWTGANSPTAGWFGPLVSAGPRDRPQVALTFDDGPNASATLAIRDLLDQAGVKGTFFSVGKAVDQRPDISRALLEDGQLLGNHSYHHDSFRWLDPSYPELVRTERAVDRDVGVCPAFFRPPHGQHTPFMAHELSRRGMTMVTWDVSAADWATLDAGSIAERVLSRVRPGSIIDLHDGLDGRVDVDRLVLVRALPAILDGLRQRGLQPVRLDVLLGRPGYLPHC